jgi:hypothetical protein
LLCVSCRGKTILGLTEAIDRRLVLADHPEHGFDQAGVTVGL